MTVSNIDPELFNAYLEQGVHIGTRFLSASMKRYIFPIRKKNIAIIDLNKTHHQIVKIAQILEQYVPSEILILTKREKLYPLILRFCKLTGINHTERRYLPGTMTNPKSRVFVEPSLLIVLDPLTDLLAVTEASLQNIPVIAVCDSNNTFRNIDAVIPGNNKGPGSIAFILFSLYRELQHRKGEPLRMTFKEFQEGAHVI